MSYTQADLNRESLKNGGSIAALTPEGRAFVDQLVRDNFSQARAEAEARIARREADRATEELENDPELLGEIQAAIASAGSDAPSTTSRAERDRQSRIEADWRRAGY